MSCHVMTVIMSAAMIQTSTHRTAVLTCEHACWSAGCGIGQTVTLVAIHHAFRMFVIDSIRRFGHAGIVVSPVGPSA